MALGLLLTWADGGGVSLHLDWGRALHAPGRGGVCASIFSIFCTLYCSVSEKGLGSGVVGYVREGRGKSVTFIFIT